MNKHGWTDNSAQKYPQRVYNQSSSSHTKIYFCTRRCHNVAVILFFIWCYFLPSDFSFHLFPIRFVYKANICRNKKQRRTRTGYTRLPNKTKQKKGNCRAEKTSPEIYNSRETFSFRQFAQVKMWPKFPNYPSLHINTLSGFIKLVFIKFRVYTSFHNVSN